MSRRTVGIAVVAMSLSLAAPAGASAATVTSLARDLHKLQGQVTTLRTQYVALQKLHNQLLTAHNNVVNCLERASVAESNGYLWNSNFRPAAQQVVFANFFFTLPAAQVNTPFASSLHQQWSVGVKNSAFCLGVVGYRDPGTSAAAANAKVPNVLPRAATSGK